jgi:hypothetical protein
LGWQDPLGPRAHPDRPDRKEPPARPDRKGFKGR